MTGLRAGLFQLAAPRERSTQNQPNRLTRQRSLAGTAPYIRGSVVQDGELGCNKGAEPGFGGSLRVTGRGRLWTLVCPTVPRQSPHLVVGGSYAPAGEGMLG